MLFRRHLSANDHQLTKSSEVSWYEIVSKEDILQLEGIFILNYRLHRKKLGHILFSRTYVSDVQLKPCLFFPSPFEKLINFHHALKLLCWQVKPSISVNSAPSLFRYLSSLIFFSASATCYFS